MAVLAINFGLFLVESVAGVLARSAALLGDSLDMLGDALVYGFQSYVLLSSARWRGAAYGVSNARVRDGLAVRVVRLTAPNVLRVVTLTPSTVARQDGRPMASGTTDPPLTATLLMLEKWCIQYTCVASTASGPAGPDSPAASVVTGPPFTDTRRTAVPPPSVQ